MKKISSLLMTALCFFFISCNNDKDTKTPPEAMTKSEVTTNKDIATIRLPTKSQYSTTTQTIGVSDVSISYYRPNVNGRTIWGNVVKWDTIWRTGAEKATVFHFDDDVMINDKSLQKGSYSFFTIPRANNSWTVIFNKNQNIYGTQYSDKDDALRFDVKAMDNLFTETMTIDISDVQYTKAKVKLSWDKKAIEFDIAYDVNNVVWKNIEANLKSVENAPDSVKWNSYYSFANYCSFSKDASKADFALDLTNKSLAIKETFQNLKLKSELFALKGNLDSAIVYAKKAHKVGSSSGMPLEVANLLEEDIAKYQASLKK